MPPFSYFTFQLVVVAAVLWCAFYMRFVHGCAYTFFRGSYLYYIIF